MCDGILNEKLKIIEEIQEIEGREESKESLQKCLSWSLDELLKYKGCCMRSTRLREPSAGQVS